MPDRLSPLDASFLFAEDRTRPMHIGGVMTFAAPEGFDFDAFVALIGQRLGLVPRWRQKVREVPAHLGLPVWVDDADFDLDYHVRHPPCPPREPTSSCARWWAGCSGGGWTGRGPCGRSTWSRGWRTAGSRWSRRPTMPWSTASRRWTSASCCSTRARRCANPARRLCPAPEPSSLDLAADAVREAMRRPRTVLDVAARAGADVREVVAGVELTVETLVSVMSGGPSSHSTR